MRKDAPRAPWARARSGRRAAASYAFLALSVVAMVIDLAGSPLGGPAFFAVAIGCTAAIGVGAALNAGSLRRPWWWAMGASTLFLAGIIGHELVPDSGPGAYLPHLASFAGYAMFFQALRLWLDPTGANRSRQDLLDALLVGLGGMLVAWAVLIVPVLGYPDHDPAHRVVVAIYPVLDIMLLMVWARIIFSRRVQSVALWLLLLVIASIFLGDITYAIADARAVEAPAFADAPFFLGFGATGAAALHPSMRLLARPVPRAFRGWGRLQLVGIGLPLFFPAVLIATVPAAGLVDRLVRAVLVAGMTAIAFFRAVQAINRYASSEQLARYRATHDPLTGLPNRQGLQSYLSEEVPLAASAGDSVSVLFMDLDGFKYVNDTYGHGVGDELLVQAGQRIRSRVRDGDFVARIGGDEFVAVARHDELAGAEGLADRIISSFHDPFHLSVGPTFISPSVGIARSGAHRCTEPEALVREADTAMYKAKAAGRNRSAVFDASLREAVRSRVEIENGLRRALEEDRLDVHYQPVVRLEDGSVLGYEALLRWRHPTLGEVPPDQFIPIAEDSWLIVPIGGWVLRRALQDVARWRRSGRRDVQVAVNISARQLRDGNLVDLVSRALREFDLPGEALCLELTESALVLDPDAAQAALTALRRLGVSIAVDDFGTGYSALGYLRRFPVSVVKIDRTFVNDLGSGGDDAIVRAVLAMTRVLNVAVVAEGVETEQQEQALRRFGCAAAQGWRYGKPESAAAVEARAALPLTPAAPLVSPS